VRFSALPPVRRTVPLRRGNSRSGASTKQFFGNRSITLYASGTAALAHSITNCAARKSVRSPEVIIPAYGCPDLVAACVSASVYPRLVDISQSDWSYDLKGLKSSLSANTVAIVAVNLLGVGDGSAELIHLCKDRHVPLIQDSAQYLPREPIDWPGDYVVLSFGRGKPLNLLRGGALIAPFGATNTTILPTHYTGMDRLLTSRAAAIAFNVLTRPHFYRVLSALPGTGLGNVTYKPLARVDFLPDKEWRRVSLAFELYRRTKSYRRQIWEPAIEEWATMGITALHCPGLPPPTEPLRLALLAPDRAARDAIVDKLNRYGLGASRLYGTELTEVPGIPDVVKHQGRFPHAMELADRLFTIPTHDLVTERTVNATRDVLKGIFLTRSG
jgi:dTDP-4-amino-4,6-dideoxygalactose transaminase